MRDIFRDISISSAFIKSRIDIVCRVRNEISQRSSLPDGQLVNEQRVLLINSPRGTTLWMDLIAVGWLEIYCTAEFNHSIILSRWTVAISKIHIQPDQNWRFDHSEYFVASREFNTWFYLPRIEKSHADLVAFEQHIYEAFMLLQEILIMLTLSAIILSDV